MVFDKTKEEGKKGRRMMRKTAREEKFSIRWKEEDEHKIGYLIKLSEENKIK